MKRACRFPSRYGDLEEVTSTKGFRILQQYAERKLVILITLLASQGEDLRKTIAKLLSKGIFKARGATHFGIKLAST